MSSVSTKSDKRARHPSRHRWDRQPTRSVPSVTTLASQVRNSPRSRSALQQQIADKDPLHLMVGEDGDRTVMVSNNDHSRGRKRSRSTSLSPSRTDVSSSRTSRSRSSRLARRQPPSLTGDRMTRVVSPSRYSVFCNAVRMSKGAFMSVNPQGESLAQASMVHLSQEEKPQKVAWGVQPQLRHAIELVSMVAQGVKKAARLSKTPYCEHTSWESKFKRENYQLKVNPDSDFPVKPPHLDGSLGSFRMPANLSVSSG